MKENLISYFPGPISNIVPSEAKTLEDVYSLIKFKFKELTEQVRNGTVEKETLPYVTPSGTYTSRKDCDLLNYSGIICMHVENCNINIKDTLCKDAFLKPALVFVSPSGKGLMVFFSINNATVEDHFKHSAAISQYLLDTYELEADKGCMDVSRACSLCHDPEVYFSYGSVDSDSLLSILVDQPELPMPEQITEPDPIESKKTEMPQLSYEKVEELTVSQKRVNSAPFPIGIAEIAQDAMELLTKATAAGFSSNLKTVLDTQEKLKIIKAGKIEFSDPVLKQGEKAVLFPHTINAIQGQAGVHKSRLAEYFCAAILKKPDCKNELLGFSLVNPDLPYTVVYVDTERNLAEQLPYALQSIQVKAGFEIFDHPANFEYISLLQVNRKDRFATLNEFLAYVRKKTTNPLLIVLDVSTDCIEDFNRADKSMELIDLMNMAINEHNVIFLCIIHENPGSEKARGHFGTELKNKSSTVIQVGFEKDSSNDDTDLIKVKYLKCRSTARHIPFHIRYSEVERGLVIADPKEVATVLANRKSKALIPDVVEALGLYLGDGATLMRKELIDKLCSNLVTSERTIESRLTEILGSDMGIFNNNGDECRQNKHTNNKIAYYSLTPVQAI